MTTRTQEAPTMEQLSEEFLAEHSRRNDRITELKQGGDPAARRYDTVTLLSKFANAALTGVVVFSDFGGTFVWPVVVALVALAYPRVHSQLESCFPTKRLTRNAASSALDALTFTTFFVVALSNGAGAGLWLFAALSAALYLLRWGVWLRSYTHLTGCSLRTGELLETKV